MTKSATHHLSPEDFNSDSLGEPSYKSPILNRIGFFAPDNARVLIESKAEKIFSICNSGLAPLSFEQAGPRENIYFKPEEINCGIVSCGGLCPGINDVIRSITLTLSRSYGVKNIYGFRYGYQGISNERHEPYHLTPEFVNNIHEEGGSILCTSRGPRETKEMISVLQHYNVKILFTIGGDGTLSGAYSLGQEIIRQNLDIAVIGIPKTIDNDLLWVERTFGFTTAVDEAWGAITAAHVEASCVWNGVGVVRLMGRESGFIAAHASLAHSDVDFCLIPEVPFSLEGKNGLLTHLQKRLEENHHAVIVIAEGAGQEFFSLKQKSDASGNIIFNDIGIYLSHCIKKHFKEHNIPASLKYIDPSYLIRSLPANAFDSEFCMVLGQHAAHAGMAGKTNLVISHWNGHFVHVPLPLIAGKRKQLDPDGHTWNRVLEATGQPSFMV